MTCIKPTYDQGIRAIWLRAKIVNTLCFKGNSGIDLGKPDSINVRNQAWCCWDERWSASILHLRAIHVPGRSRKHVPNADLLLASNAIHQREEIKARGNKAYYYYKCSTTRLHNSIRFSRAVWLHIKCRAGRYRPLHIRWKGTLWIISRLSLLFTGSNCIVPDIPFQILYRQRILNNANWWTQKEIPYKEDRLTKVLHILERSLHSRNDQES